MDDNLRTLCRVSMRKTFAYFDWQLVDDEETFLDEVLLELEHRRSEAESLDQAAQLATINCYCRLWYNACCADGSAVQQRAFVEVHHYAYRLALSRTGHDEYLAGESAQEAAIEVWQRLGTVREPEAFMKWIKVIAASKVYHQLRKGMQRIFDKTTGQSTWRAREVTESDHAALLREDLQTQLPVESDTRTQLETTIRKCLRSRRQQEALIGCFLDGKTHVEVAQQLGISPQRLSVLKTRAKARLRRCDEFMNVADDLA